MQTAPQAAMGLDARTVAEISSRNNEPDWLRDLRAAWWRELQETPEPSGQEEEWRRTSLVELPRSAPLLTEPPRVRCELPEDLAAAGVIFADLRDAIRDHGELVRRHLGQRRTMPAQAHFWALAHAAWTGGTFLYVPSGVAVDRPLTAVVELPEGGHAHHPLTLLVAERDSSVALLEEVRSPDGAATWFGGVADILAGPGSRVRYANLQQLGSGAWNVGAQRVEVGQDAHVTTLNAEVGSFVTKIGLDVRMTGTGGTSSLLGVLAAGDTQHIDINTLQDLAASHTTSDLLYLSALYDEARAAFYGVTRVEQQAKATSSYQECRNLLLSPKAGAEPIPVLEIETNDILRCGHGATAGAIDPTQRFYVQARGLSEEEAERLIVRGFFEQVLAQLDSALIRDRVLAALAPRIGVADVDFATQVVA
ncbi:MAG TPA: SufD family Fe-S cluster assembly protein [candidate division Zixibacteria bacterium]|nr:SufD family Fe-S cluster assembly protein [candidate division Zixibacteria bacterium]